MKRAAITSSLSLTILLSLVCAVVAQDKQGASSATNKSQTANSKNTPTEKSSAEKQKAANPTPQGQSGAQPNTSAKASNQGVQPSAPPSAKLLDLVRANDLLVRVVMQVTGVPTKTQGTLNGAAGSITLRAEFANGQVASATALVGNDTRNVVLTLTPVTPNDGSLNSPQTVKEKIGGVDLKGVEGSGAAPAGGGFNPSDKEKRSLPKPGGTATAISLGGGAPKLIRATAQLTFNVKQGNQNVVLTDQITRNF